MSLSRVARRTISWVAVAAAGAAVVAGFLVLTAPASLGDDETVATQRGVDVEQVNPASRAMIDAFG